MSLFSCVLFIFLPKNVFLNIIQNVVYNWEIVNVGTLTKVTRVPVDIRLRSIQLFSMEIKLLSQAFGLLNYITYYYIVILTIFFNSLFCNTYIVDVIKWSHILHVAMKLHFLPLISHYWIRQNMMLKFFVEMSCVEQYFGLDKSKYPRCLLFT